MVSVIVETRSAPFAVTNPGGNSNATFAIALLPSTTKPAGDGVVVCGDGGSVSRTQLQLMPYGVGAPSSSFVMAIYGWRDVINVGAQAPTLWVPYLLASWVCFLSNPRLTGIDGTPVNSSQLFCDTISTVTGNLFYSEEVVSPTLGIPAHIMVDVKGSRLAQLVFGTNGSAQSANCLCAAV